MPLNKKDKQQLIIISVGLLIFVAVLSKNLSKIFKKKKTRPKTATKELKVENKTTGIASINLSLGVVSSNVDVRKGKGDLIKMQEESLKKNWGVDPFFPAYDLKRQEIEKPPLWHELKEKMKILNIEYMAVIPKLVKMEYLNEDFSIREDFLMLGIDFKNAFPDLNDEDILALEKLLKKPKKEEIEKNDTKINIEAIKPEDDLKDIKLTGISKVGKQYFATINRKILRENDNIKDYKVLNIKKGEVILEKNRKQYILQLK